MPITASTDICIENQIMRKNIQRNSSSFSGTVRAKEKACRRAFFLSELYATSINMHGYSNTMYVVCMRVEIAHYPPIRRPIRQARERSHALTVHDYCVYGGPSVT